MPKKFTNENTKVTRANEKRAAAQADKDAKKNKEKAAKEEAEWAVGSKDRSRKVEEEQKKVWFGFLLLIRGCTCSCHASSSCRAACLCFFSFCSRFPLIPK